MKKLSDPKQAPLCRCARASIQHGAVHAPEEEKSWLEWSKHGKTDLFSIMEQTIQDVQQGESQQEIKRLQAALKEKETENNKLKYSNLEMQVQVVELKSDINELKQQVNFLASQMQIVESDVLVMKNKKPSSFLARN